MISNRHQSGGSQNQKLYQQLKFLQAQNTKLKDQISDLKDMISINKIQIDVLSKNETHDKKLIDVIYNYRQQLENAHKRNQVMNTKYQNLVSQKLVNQQLNQQLQSEQVSLEELHKLRLNQLITTIKDLEKKIQKCQKTHQNYDNITGFVEKNRDLFTPLEQAIQFKNKQFGWEEEITHMKEELMEHKKNQENLLLANGVLRNKVVSLQAKLAMPNKNLGQILDKSLKRLMLYFIQTQKRMLTGEDSESQQDDLELIAPQLASLFPQRQTNSHSDYKVPALDILKVRNYQLKGNQKIKQELLRRNHLTKDQKIQRLEVELQFTRRSLTKNLIKVKTQTEKRKILQKICEQLQERNYFLIKSNESYQSKIQKIRKNYQNNKQKILSSNKIDIFEDEGLLDMTIIRRESNPYNQQKSRQMEVNKYLESVQTPFQFKLHMQLLAKDLDRNPKLKNLKEGKLRKQSSDLSKKLKRSTSNPFMYFNERRDQIMQIKPERQNLISSSMGQNNQRQRLEQTEYLAMGNDKIKFSEDVLDDLQ